MRDERALPLFLHIVRNREYRRTARKVYESAIEALGALGGREAVESLSNALRDGALRQIGSPEATAALTDASEQGSRGARNAARQQLARGVATRRSARREEA